MSSYALRRVRLTPTMGLVAWMIASTKEGSISYPKLEQLLFLVDWKLAQSTGKPIIEDPVAARQRRDHGAGLFQAPGR